MKELTKILNIGILVVAILLVIFAVLVAPTVIRTVNKWQEGNIEADIETNWNKQKEIEDTLRAYIASYEADKVTYETAKNSTDKAMTDLANASKVRANRTAVAYNEYYLKNSHIWKDNVPSDIRSELPLIE